MPLVAISYKPLKLGQSFRKSLQTEVFRMDSSLCQDTFYTDTCDGSLERTRQTSLGVGAILANSHASVAM